MKKKGIQKKFAPRIRFRLTGESYPEDRLSARIEILGRNTVIIEDCRAVSEYDCDSITFAARAPVRIRGTGLELREFDKGIATVKGVISAVELL